MRLITLGQIVSRNQIMHKTYKKTSTNAYGTLFNMPSSPI